MSELMKSIEGVKCSEVFDFTKVGFPASWSDKMVLVGGRAIRNYDRLVEENQRLTAIATKHATRADELHEALESLINAVKNNTGNEPSLSCYHKAIDDAVDALDKSRIEAEKGDGICN